MQPDDPDSPSRIIAATLSGNPGMFDSIVPSVKVRVNLGPLTPEERDAIIKQHEASLISPETALKALGSRDVDAELIRLEDDPINRLDLIQKQVEVATSMVEAGVDLKMVAELTGLEPGVVDQMFNAVGTIVEQ